MVGGWRVVYDYNVSLSPNLWIMTFDLDLDLDLGLTNILIIYVDIVRLPGLDNLTLIIALP